MRVISIAPRAVGGDRLDLSIVDLVRTTRVGDVRRIIGRRQQATHFGRSAQRDIKGGSRGTNGPLISALEDEILALAAARRSSAERQQLAASLSFAM